jgi:hypothetical protein
MLACCEGDEAISGGGGVGRDEADSPSTAATRANAAAARDKGSDNAEEKDTMVEDAKDSAPRGFRTGDSFTGTPSGAGVRFDQVSQELYDQSLPGKYKVTSHVRDQIINFTLLTEEGDPVTVILLEHDWTADTGYLVRIYAVVDMPHLTPAALAVRERLNFASFASAIAVMPFLRRSAGPYKIYYKPLAPGEVLGN